MKNLLILHLESISRARLAAFPAAFPNLRRLLAEARTYNEFVSSATSTMMVITYFFHANDYEFDAVSEFMGARPAGNNRDLFSILRECGYATDVICLNGFHHLRPQLLAGLSGILPPVWGTADYPALFARFDELTNAPRFAIYIWDLVPHIEHSLALAPFAHGLCDQVARACAAADHAVGTFLATLERKRLLADTTIVAHGDHGDDFWTHGFRGGMIHGTEPYSEVVRTPLAIRDVHLAPGTDARLASTIDIAPTCLDLLGIAAAPAFADSGRSLLGMERDLAFAQNLFANQPDDRVYGIRKAFAVTNGTHALLASSQGLELYAPRLDPGNHCNLLHFFDLGANEQPVFRPPAVMAGHFRAALQDNPAALDRIAADFERLRAALAARVAAKRAYIVERGVEPNHALDPRAFTTINRAGREAFFARADAAPHAAMPSYQFSYRLG